MVPKEQLSIFNFFVEVWKFSPVRQSKPHSPPHPFRKHTQKLRLQSPLSPYNARPLNASSHWVIYDMCTEEDEESWTRKGILAFQYAWAHRSDRSGIESGFFSPFLFWWGPPLVVVALGHAVVAALSVKVDTNVASLALLTKGERGREELGKKTKGDIGGGEERRRDTDINFRRCFRLDVPSVPAPFVHCTKS